MALNYPMKRCQRDVNQSINQFINWSFIRTKKIQRTKQNYYSQVKWFRNVKNIKKGGKTWKGWYSLPYLRKRKVSTAKVAWTIICVKRVFMASGNMAKLSGKNRNIVWNVCDKNVSNKNSFISKKEVTVCGKKFSTISQSINRKPDR